MPLLQVANAKFKTPRNDGRFDMSTPKMKRDEAATNATIRCIPDLPARTVSPFILMFFFAFVFTVPFDGLDLFGAGGVFTLTKAFGLLFGLACLFQPTVCYARPPRAIWWFAIYTAVYFMHDVLRTSLNPLDIGYVITVTQAIVLCWISFNIIRWSPNIQGAVLVTLVISIATLIGLAHLGFAGDVDARGRATAGSLGANYLGFLYGVGLLSSVGIFRYKGLPYWVRLASLAFAVIFAVACIRTGSRSAMAATTVAIVVYVVAVRGVITKAKGIVLGAVLLGGFVVLLLRSEVARQRWDEAIYEGKVAKHDLILYSGIQMFMERPIFGWGPYTFLVELAGRQEDAGEIRDTHNDILWALAATGLSGGGFFIAGLVGCAMAAWKGRDGPWGTLAFALMALFLTVGMLNPLHKRKTVWLIMGCALASPYIARATMPPPVVRSGGRKWLPGRK